MRKIAQRGHLEVRGVWRGAGRAPPRGGGLASCFAARGRRSDPDLAM